MRGKRKSTGAGTSPAKRPKLSNPAAEKEQRKSRVKPVDSVCVDEEESEFPRGGKETLTPLEKKLIKQQAQQDLLFGEGVGGDVSSAGVGVAKAGKKKKAKAAASSSADTLDGAKKPPQQKRLDIMNAKKLVPGVLVLGAVLEIHEYEVLISLPFNMRGSVAATDVSDHMTRQLETEAERLDTEENDEDVSSPSLSRLFHVGQLLPCYVLGVEGGSRVSLSTNPQLVNSHLTHRDIRPGMLLCASVQSVEDHGYIIDFYVENKTGFLLRKNAAEFIKSSNKGKSLCVGQVIHCLVLPGPDARSVPVSINPSQVGGALLSGDTLLGINALLPGLLVNAAVKEVASNGLLMSFLGGFEGVVSLHHLSSPSHHSTETFHPKKKFRARVLWVDMAIKTMGLTIQKQVVSGRSYQFEDIEIGDIFEAAKVIHVDHTSSLYLELGNDIIGFAPTRLISDENTSSSSYRPGTLHSCRVVQFNIMDGVAIVSLQASVLEKPYMKYADISVGETVEGTVERFGDFGMIVALTEHIRGLCPRLHLSDVRSIMKQPKKKYKEGSKVKCRVLRVEPSQRRLLLTCKKSLLRSSHDPLTDYTQARPGSIHHGVISSVHNYGCIVHFFNRVRGLVLKSELSSTHMVQDPSAEFWIGQPVECRVLESEPASQKLLLSLRLHDFLPVSVEQDESLAPGDIIDAEVMGIASNGINLRCPRTGELVFLPSLHLSDYPALCTHLLNLHQARLEKALKEGKVYTLEGVLVVSCRHGSRPAQVTLKQTLLKYAKEKGFAANFTDFKVGMVQPGFVKKLMAYGCFVEFPHGISGLAPLKFLTDEFISSPTGVYGETQTVWAKVQDISDEQGRLLLSLRPSDLKLTHQMDLEEASSLIVSNLHGYLRERDSVLAGVTERSSAKEELTGGRTIADLAQLFQPGGCVSGHVISTTEKGVVIELEGGVIGKAVTGSAASLKVGNQLTGCVLDIDLVEYCLVLNLNPQLATSLSSSKRQSKKRPAAISGGELQPGSTLLAIVEHKTPHYFVLSCNTIAGARLAYGVMDTGQIGVLPSQFKNIKVGQQVTTTVTNDEYRDIPIVMVTETVTSSYQVKSSIITKPASSTKQVKEGEILSVVVQSVKPTQLNVKYNIWRGRVHCTLAKDDDVVIDDITVTSSGKPKKRTIVFAGISNGSVLKARVIKIKDQQITRQASNQGATIKVLELTTKPSLLDADVEVNSEQLLKKKFSPGKVVNGVVEQVQSNGLQILLSPRSEGFVPLLRVSKSIEVLQNVKRCFCEGQLVKCTVLGPKKDSKKKGLYDLSMIGDIGSLSKGDVVPALIKEVVPDQALLLTTPHSMGRVDITDITDHYTDNPLEELKKNTFVKCCVVGVDGSKLDLSLRRSRTGEPASDIMQTDTEGEEEGEGGEGVAGRSCDPEIASLEDLEVGKVVRGFVKAVTDVGVFVRLGRGIDGRVQITHLIDGFVKNFKKLFSPGKVVRAKVLSIDPVKKRVDLSLRLSQVDPQAAKKLRMKKQQKKKKQTTKLSSDGESVEPEESSSEESSASSDDSSSSSSEEDEQVEQPSSDEETEEQNTTKKKSSSLLKQQQQQRQVAKPTLKLPSGFCWDDVDVVKDDGGTVTTSSESEEEADQDEQEPVSKKSRRQKRAAKKAEEVSLYQTEQALLETDRAPENADDFDRLLISSPNNSALWTQYMAFFLHTAEVDKARNIAQRALKTISYREEGEKLNIWVAWMNLENLYGSHEQLVKVFESALQQNEPLEVFFRLVAIYEQSNKMELADQLYQTMTKKFGTVLKVWSQYSSFLMKRRRLDAARNLLQRSLKILTSKQDHVDIISKFAQLEFKHGEPERGRTMFESLVSTYPRRVDLWAVYTDMMIKLGDTQKVRDIYERAIHLKLSTKKMKFMFKRYLEFEQKYGSGATVESVKEKARAYVEARTGEM